MASDFRFGVAVMDSMRQLVYSPFLIPQETA
jgi:hypothetical protein